MPMCCSWVQASGNLGGFVGQYVMGAVESGTGSGAGGLYVIAAIAGAVVVTGFRWVGQITRTPAERTEDDAHRALR